MDRVDEVSRDALESALQTVNLRQWYGPEPGWYSIQPERGEILPRKVRVSYMDLSAERDGYVDLDMAPLMQRDIEREVRVEHLTNVLHQRVPLVLAYWHLEDARNEALRRHVREMHFDLAGRMLRMYDVLYQSDKRQTPVTVAIDRWREGNGI